MNSPLLLVTNDIEVPMTVISPEQRQALAESGDSAIELADPQTGDSFVMVRAEVYHQMREELEYAESLRELGAWSKVAKKARDQWASENPY